MPSLAGAGAAASIVGGVGGLISGSSAAKKAASAQTKAAKNSIEEQRRQFDMIQEMLKPYVETGTTALGQQANLAGVNGADMQQRAINALEKAPQFQALMKQGEDAMLQNASATGGLRGGNLQGALAQFRPSMLNQQIQQQLGNLGGMATMGQNSAAQVGTAGQNMANAVSQQYGQIGAAQAGAAKAQGEFQAGLYNLPANIMGTFSGARIF